MAIALDEHVVVVDALGRPASTLPKGAAHGPDTPLHLAFSCHVVGPDGRVLLTRRARSKRTWPGVWSNACCGHPQTGERLGEAVTRRLGQELGVRPERLHLLLPDFAYRATMGDGTVEHELCPVVVAEVRDMPVPDPVEVDDVAWVEWPALLDRARTRPETLSPWSVEQLAAMDALGWRPGAGGRPMDLVDAVHDRAVHDSIVHGREGCDPVAPVRAPVDALLHDFLDRKVDELLEIDPALGPPATEIRAMVAAGGKRLRPAFVHWGHQVAGGRDRPPAVAAAGAAIELLHTFALLHDDVMDRSPQRRGRDAAHVALARHHAAAGLTGDARWFGASAAILAGDLAFVWADELLERAEVRADIAAAVRRVFTTLRAEVMAGQYLDLRHAADPRADEEGARRVALLKSARYTVTRPLELGAALAGGADPVVAGALRTYGDAIGVAFQLRDDVLGVFGDPSSTGKGTLDDLREGKRTLLVLRALRLGSGAQRAAVRAALGDPHLDAHGAAAARDAIAASGALASVERLIAAEHARAVDAIADVPRPARDALRALATRAVRRDR